MTKLISVPAIALLSVLLHLLWLCAALAAAVPAGLSLHPALVAAVLLGGIVALGAVKECCIAGRGWLAGPVVAVVSAAFLALVLAYGMTWPVPDRLKPPPFGHYVWSILLHPKRGPVVAGLFLASLAAVCGLSRMGSWFVRVRRARVASPAGRPTRA